MIKFFLSILLLNLSIIHGREIPALSSPVVDEVNLLSRSERAQFISLLKEIEQTQKAQIQILIIDSLGDQPIEDFSIKVVDKWKLGQTKSDNGLLFLISLNDRKMRLEIGQGLEGTITDLDSSRILREVKTYFRENRHAQGIAQALILISQKLEIDPNALGAVRQQNTSSNYSGMGIFVAVILLFYFLSIAERRRFNAHQNDSVNSWSRGSHDSWTSRSSGGWPGGGGGGETFASLCYLRFQPDY